jgi:hypothetical protein
VEIQLVLVQGIDAAEAMKGQLRPLAAELENVRRITYKAQTVVEAALSDAEVPEERQRGRLAVDLFAHFQG